MTIKIVLRDWAAVEDAKQTALADVASQHGP